MLKRVIYFCLLILYFIVLPASANDFKITDVKTDYSRNNIVLTGLTSSDVLQYKAAFAQNPLRAYIDLENCVLNGTKTVYTFTGKPVKKIAIAQYSVKPNKVRLVFYSDNENILKNIKLIKNGNSLTFKLNSFKNTSSSIPLIFSDTLPKQYAESTLTNASDTKFSKYVLTKIHETPTGIMLSGIGNIRLARPFILLNPIRIVFDLQNATVNKKIIYGEYKLANGDMIKVGQFNADTLRFVITTNSPAEYKSFISPDLQSVYLTNVAGIKNNAENPLINGKIPAKVKKVSLSQPSVNETLITINFDHPVIHSPKRTYNKFLLDFLNVNYSENAQLFSAKSTKQFGGFITKNMIENSDKLSVLIPVGDNSKIQTGMSLDGKNIAIKISGNLETAKPPEIKQTHVSKPVVTQPQKPVEKKVLPLENKVIVVDAGHGGKDSGAISGKMYEKVPALNMALLLQKNLEEKGAKVIMTRKDDTFLTLQDRVSISNFENADLFVSIHLNSSEKSNINGIETHWYKSDSKLLAEKVQNALIKNVKGANNRGLFNSMFYVIHHTTAPAILVETGFISNPQERDALFTAERQKITAKAISDGIIEYVQKGNKK